MTDFGKAAEHYLDQLRMALKHFEYSWKKIGTLPIHPEQLNEEQLETWESFSSRFSRVVDLFLTKYVRARVLQNDPGFRGTLRDFVNQGEKLRLVPDADRWMGLSELRNIEAHTYSDDLERFLRKLREMAPEILKLKAIPETSAGESPQDAPQA